MGIFDCASKGSFFLRLTRGSFFDAKGGVRLQLGGLKFGFCVLYTIPMDPATQIADAVIHDFPQGQTIICRVRIGATFCFSRDRAGLVYLFGVTDNENFLSLPLSSLSSKF
jgi:hypothetical protein